LAGGENAAQSAEYTLTPTSANSRMNWTTAGGAPMNWTTATGAPMVWSAISTGLVVFDPLAIGQQGVLLGFSLSTKCADMALISGMVAPEQWEYRG